MFIYAVRLGHRRIWPLSLTPLLGSFCKHSARPQLFELKNEDAIKKESMRHMSMKCYPSHYAWPDLIS
jgi:hypothetical protein